MYEFNMIGYACPRCHARISELPADCAVCGLKLVLAPHLARSFHHLFPVAPFIEIGEDVQVADSYPSKSTSDTASNEEKMDIEQTAPSKVMSSLPPLITSSSSRISPTSSSKIDYYDDGIKTVDVDSKLLTSSKDFDRCCFACLKIIGGKSAPPVMGDSRQQKKQNKEHLLQITKEQERLRFQCPECKNVFCADCDAYLHETLHNCPGCLLR